MSWGKNTSNRLSRRDFLRRGSIAAGACFGMPASSLGQRLLKQADNDRVRRLVLLELSGGNDGLNTVVPVYSDAYRRLRPTLSLSKNEVLDLGSGIGINAALIGLKTLWDQGVLAVIQGCGYPNPSRKHSTALNYWRTAGNQSTESGLWLSRLTQAPEDHVGNGPTSGVARRPPETAGLALPREPQSISGLSGIDYYPVLNDHRSIEASLAKIAQMIRAGSQNRISYLRLGGFDTHSNQATTHRQLLSLLGGILYRFFKAIDRSGQGNEVAVMVYSEFGRKVRENSGLGTDHGTAGPVLLIGGKVKGGLYGAHPSLTDLDDQGDLKMTVDFRRVYATLITEWLGRGDARAILGGGFPALGIFA